MWQGVSKISHEYQKGFKQRRSNMTMTLLLADPFRYQGQESKVVYEFLVGRSKDTNDCT